MNSKISKRIFIILFALLYISVAFVSTFHAISFFGLANYEWIAVMLAITFEIGQAAVLFSILTGASGKNKVIPWILMIVLTLVQILGNVYSSYKYLITNSEDLLRYFKEPIFVWMDIPNDQCNVILTYIVGAILPIVSLLMTSMVTNYINKPEEPEKPNDETPSNEPQVITPLHKVDEEPEKPKKDKPIQLVNFRPQDIVEHEEPIEERVEEPVEEKVEEPIEEKVEEPVEEEPQKESKISHFINAFKK